MSAKKKQKLGDKTFYELCESAETNAAARRVLFTRIPKEYQLDSQSLGNLLQALRTQPKTYDDAIELVTLLVNHVGCSAAMQASLLHSVHGQGAAVFFEEMVKTCAHNDMLPRITPLMRHGDAQQMLRTLNMLTFRFIDISSIRGAQYLAENKMTIKFRTCGSELQPLTAPHVNKWASLLCSSINRFVVIDFPELKQRGDVFWPIPEHTYNTVSHTLSGAGAHGYVLYHMCKFLAVSRVTDCMLANEDMRPIVISMRTTVKELHNKLLAHEALVMKQAATFREIREEHATSLAGVTTNAGLNLKGKCVPTMKTAAASFVLHVKSVIQATSEVGMFHRRLCMAAHGTGVHTVIAMQMCIMTTLGEAWPALVLHQIMVLVDTMAFVWLKYAEREALIQKTTDSMVRILSDRMAIRKRGIK